STATFTVSGLSTGEAVCLSGAGLTGVGASVGGAVAVPVALPTVKGNRTRTLTATGASGAVTATTLTILGKRKLPLALKKSQVARGKKQKVVVKGLAPGEKVKVKLRKKKVRAGTANAQGRFAAKFKVRGKLGRAKVKVTGQFPAIRKNTATFRVVR
ncbi:hypothetical protein, partial [Nocardioides sp.]|uniref:hypothetical protein n=1 Tax=Nocardioides sp. TaxID=35761 RepID=UPI002732E7D1